MVIGTALGFSNWGTVALAVALAFLFGYLLTSLPLLRAGLALGAVIPIALASDTLSIAVMEIVDNAVLIAIPGAMHAGVDTVLFWGSLAFALVVAGVVAVPVNRYLIARGRGHAKVHETGIHGGPPVKARGRHRRGRRSCSARRCWASRRCPRTSRRTAASTRPPPARSPSARSWPR